MRCNVCGRYTSNEDANFCDYCGSPYREQFQAYYNTQQQNSTQNRYNYGENRGHSGYQQENKPVSFLDYLLSYGLFFIPIAGWIIFFVMLFVWAFSDNTPVSKKNWARATLIFMGVMMIFIVYSMYILMGLLYQNMISGGFDYNKYIQSFRH